MSTIDVPSVSLLLSYVSGGLGIGLVPALAMAEAPSALRADLKERLSAALALIERAGAKAADATQLARQAASGLYYATAAALFLREFTGDSRPAWAHFDMSAPSWADATDGELTKGATGWGVRTLVNWVEARASDAKGSRGAAVTKAKKDRKVPPPAGG